MLLILRGFGFPDYSSAQTSGFQQTLVTGGLNSPTAMEFAPDGRLFVAEQAGHLRVISIHFGLDGKLYVAVGDGGADSSNS
ncbi:MAG: hypothetical protein AUI36_12495 [Cyanobacteria bacterium 13_1_40CM_2_61_4]|nr:MAG: hypothetical protein AUI36_12495 [Cyanobacteria bacterium 13_1_40CM_2_61_4]